MTNKELSNKFIIFNTLLVSGIALFSPILYIFLIKFGYSYTEAGIYLSVFWGVSAISELPSGFIADTVGQKLTIIFSCFLRAIGLVILLVDNFSILILSAIITGVAESMMSGTLSSWLLNQSNDKKSLNLDKIFSRSAFYGSIFSLIIGFLIAQYVFPNNTLVPIALSTIFFILLGIMILKYLPEKKIYSHDTEQFFLKLSNQLKENFIRITKVFKSNKIIILFILLLIWPTILDIGPSNQWQVAFNDTTESNILGYLWIMISLVGIMTNLVLPKIPRISKSLVDISIYILLDIVVILLSTFTSYNILFFLVHIALFTILNIRITVYIQGTLVTDDRIRSSLVSMFYTLEALVTMILLPINGHYSEQIGVLNTWSYFALFTGVLVIFNIIIILLVSHFKKKSQAI